MQVTRLYDLVAINERTGKQTRLNNEALTHSEACTLRSKFNIHKDVRILLVQRSS